MAKPNSKLSAAARAARLAGVLAAAALLPASLPAQTAPAAAAAPTAPAAPGAPWVTAYFLSGDDDTGRMPLSQIDFSAITDLIDFCLFPNPDGTLTNITPRQSLAAVAAAHAAGCKVLVCLGSQGDGREIRAAVSPPNRAALVRNLVQLAVSRGYDGIDLDYEPLEERDAPDFKAFVAALRAAMNAARPGMLLTAAVGGGPDIFAALQGDFDQLNLMTYDNSGLYPDFKSWYNSSLYGDPSHVMERGKRYPSVDRTLKLYLAAGVKPSKLGIGVAFYGYVWSGVSGPRQTIQGVPGVAVDDGADYSAIMDKYYQPALFHWDPVADAPYLSIDAPRPQERKFVSYDDEALCRMKVAYARQQGLGGVMIWELGGGYRASQPPGRRDALLQAVKQARADAALDDPRQVPTPTR